MNHQEMLINKARQAQAMAKAPYSHYQVGAAVLAESGAVYAGCNIESGAYSTTICAERVAIFTAIANGEQGFTALAVVTRDGGTPCGSCRQVIHEQCGDIPIYLSGNGETVETSTLEMLPNPFTFHDD